MAAARVLLPQAAETAPARDKSTRATAEAAPVARRLVPERYRPCTFVMDMTRTTRSALSGGGVCAALPYLLPSRT